MVSTSLEYRLVSPQELGEGSYQISRVADEQIGEGRHKFCPAEYFVPGDPQTLPSLLSRYLTEFSSDSPPFIKRIIMEEARFRDGITTGSRLDYADLDKDPAKWSAYSEFIRFNGFNLGLEFNKKPSYADQRGSATFSLKDLGSIRFKDNKWSFIDPCHNGQFSVSTTGYNATKQCVATMVGSINISGDRPGELIAVCLEVTRNFLLEQDYPLWRKET